MHVPTYLLGQLSQQPNMMTVGTSIDKVGEIDKQMLFE